MLKIGIGIFIVLHGLVYLLYFGLSRKLFELDKPLVGFPERSWLFSKFLNESAVRSLASLLFALTILILVVSGTLFLFDVNGWRSVLMFAAVFASVTTILFWDGKLQRLPDKGFIGVLINVVILGAVILL